MAQTKTIPSKLNKLKQLIKEMDELMHELSDFGAADSEPDGVFQVQLVRAIEGKNPQVPATARGWELYSMPGATAAARKLASKTQQAVTLINGLTVRETAPVRKYLEDYCWRVSW